MNEEYDALLSLEMQFREYCKDKRLERRRHKKNNDLPRFYFCDGAAAAYDGMADLVNYVRLAVEADKQNASTKPPEKCQGL